MTPKPPACQDCPLYSSGLGFVRAEGPLDSPYILVGEGPGENEATFGTPFFHNAPSGRRLNDWLNRAGLSRPDIYITNAIRCYTVKRDRNGAPLRSNGRYQKRDPKPNEVLACAKRHLLPELTKLMTTTPSSASGRRALIPVGKAAQLLLLGAAGNRYTGSLQPWTLESLRTRLRLTTTGEQPTPTASESSETQ